MTENAGGKEAFILSAFRLLKDSYSFTFLVDRDDVAHQEELLALGARIARVPARRQHPIGYVRAVSRLVRTGGFHAVWLHQTVISSIEPLVAARAVGVPVRVLHSHSSANMSGRVSGILHHLQRPLTGLYANRRYACSAEAAQWLFGDTAWTFVPNIFDPDPFSFDADRRARVRRQLGLHPQERAVVHVARLGPAKNHAFDLRIMEELRAMGVRAQLLLCGDGPYRENLAADVQRMSLDHMVTFLGPRKDVPDLLQAADVMILPSTFEGLPYTALEAQAAGLPLLLSQAVSTSAQVGGQVTVLDLARGPAPWAQAIAAVDPGASPRRPNAVKGSPFDAGTALPRFQELLAADTPKES
ncbi:glycosyltransferase family 1 protein [Actinomyces sp. 2119]|uniref:Glycosyltransferase family 1 protein n=1 Tax=Actinomyces lilanjuaniae TaxID=2321394 RepID=A0ABM6Z4M7_9ACTO|nr:MULTISPECIES: glycosyltransferase [Actinomyces]AYD90108.1 glycosyltransferase family 1 protein [Actinomyces lilanjuaniae]RJF42616.1 glycosyltransferase family 1 protein [Actinomyces sp. 2119]